MSLFIKIVSIHVHVLLILEKLLGKNFVEFSALDDSFSKAGFILGCENWDRYDFEALLKLVRSFVLSIWDARKDNLYGDHSDAISDCSSSCPLTRGPTSSACIRGCVVNGVSAMAAS